MLIARVGSFWPPTAQEEILRLLSSLTRTNCQTSSKKKGEEEERNSFLPPEEGGGGGSGAKCTQLIGMRCGNQRGGRRKRIPTRDNFQRWGKRKTHTKIFTGIWWCQKTWWHYLSRVDCTVQTTLPTRTAQPIHNLFFLLKASNFFPSKLDFGKANVLVVICAVPCSALHWIIWQTCQVVVGEIVAHQGFSPPPPPPFPLLLEAQEEETVGGGEKEGEKGKKRRNFWRSLLTSSSSYNFSRGEKNT